MNLTREEIDLLDRHLKGVSTPEEAAELSQLLVNDKRFSEGAEQYFSVIAQLKENKKRSELRSVLDSAHAEMEKPSAIDNHVKFNLLKKRAWLLPAIAASIAIIAFASIFLLTTSWKQEETDRYYELRRNVEQIKKSQNIILKDIQSQKKASNPKESFAGSGFLISAGFISTSYHVVKEADSVLVENENYGRLKAVVVYSDLATDVAILKIIAPSTIKELPPYAIASKEARLAEEVFTLGFPREDIVFGSGTVSANTGYQGNPNAYQISVPVNPGNSGGPLFNSKGDVIGIISGKQMEASGAAFATKSTKVLEVLSTQAPDSIRTSLLTFRRTTQPTTSRVNQVSQWRKFVFVVRVYKN